MQAAVSRFLKYLHMERNASDLTTKSYREDLDALVEYLTELQGRTPAPQDVGTVDLRGYIAALHEAAYAKTTIARRLASLRSFFRFGQREGWTKGNPAKPLRNPRKARSLPHFLSSEDIAQVARRAAGCRTARTARPGDSGNALFGRPPRERAGRVERSAISTCAGGALRVRGKGRRERVAPVGSSQSAALEDWRTAGNSRPREKPGPPAPVFVNKFGRRLTTRAWAGCWRSICKITGLDRRTTPAHAATQLCHAPAGPPAQTSAACRSCWDTRAWSPRKSTRTSARRDCARYKRADPAAN